jgi:hypothetical protein
VDPDVVPQRSSPTRNAALNTSYAPRRSSNSSSRKSKPCSTSPPSWTSTTTSAQCGRTSTRAAPALVADPPGRIVAALGQRHIVGSRTVGLAPPRWVCVSSPSRTLLTGSPVGRDPSAPQSAEVGVMPVGEGDGVDTAWPFGYRGTDHGIATSPPRSGTIASPTNSPVPRNMSALFSTGLTCRWTSRTSYLTSSLNSRDATSRIVALTSSAVLPLKLSISTKTPQGP